MNVEKFIQIIGADFFTGVPDSQLKALCNYLLNHYGMNPKHHIIAANEGNAAAIAAGYYLATGNIPVVYLQNSGEGNIINPLASLLNHRVYGIPCMFIVGWRGEPGIKDEPQHAFQGEITLKLLEDMEIPYLIIDETVTQQDLQDFMNQIQNLFTDRKQVAFVIRKNSLHYEEQMNYQNGNTLLREEAIKQIIRVASNDIIVSTTGKTSRELFEIRTENGQLHDHDFLTVGSMGHCSSIAMGIALQKKEKRVWCLDGDGAMLMHMGAMAVIGNASPKNLVHIILNNAAHESVGGMPTVAGKIDIISIARACGYDYVARVSNEQDLVSELKQIADKKVLCLLEIQCAIGSRADLGRPTISPKNNMYKFMKFLECT